jgi:tight adherence protein B
MEGMFLPILAAGAVALLVFVVAQFVGTMLNPDKRKLKERLTGDGRLDDKSPNAQRNIVLQQQPQGLGSILIQYSFFDKLEKMLRYASPEMTLTRFVTIALGVGVSVLVITLLVTQSLIVAGVAGAIGIYGPCIWLSRKGATRQKMIGDQLPEGLDFLGRILKAGHSLSTGLQMLADELPKPLAGEFRRTYDQHSLGQSMEDSLRDMATRIDSTDFAFFVTAVLIQRQTGGDLSEVLGNISSMIRQRIRLQQHVRAKTAEGRFTGYILAAFPAVMFVIAYALNREYAGVLINTNIGLTMLGVAFGLQLMGLYCIRRITTVEV